LKPIDDACIFLLVEVVLPLLDDIRAYVMKFLDYLVALDHRLAIEDSLSLEKGVCIASNVLSGMILRTSTR
jgi:hypothetical protein